jgi:hypothetical protein
MRHVLSAISGAFNASLLLLLIAVSQNAVSVSAINDALELGICPITDFGAIPDDNEDDTTAIAAAINCAVNGKKSLFIPGGTYDVTGSGSQIFTESKPIENYGVGYYSLIRVSASVPTTRDVFLYNGDPTDSVFPVFRDFRIAGAVAGVGRHGINITTPSNSYAFRVGIERMEFSNLAGYGVWADQSAANTSVHTSWIKDSRFLGNGFGGTSLYDSWLLQNLQFAGTGYAINFTSIAGAGKFTLRDSNVTATSGVQIGGTAGAHANLLLDNNYFETVLNYDGASGAYVNLAGASGFSLNTPMVTRNIFTILTGKGDPHALQLDYTNDGVVETNWFNVNPTASYSVVVTANSKRAYIAPDNVYLNAGAGRLSNAGTMTSGGSKFLTVLNADSTALANFTTPPQAFDKSYVIKANYLKPGQALRLRSAGRYSVTGTPTLTIALRIGGQTVATAGEVTNSGFTNASWTMNGQVTFRTVGAAATVARATDMQVLGANGAGSNLTMNTTTDLTVDVTVQWSVANPANTATMTQFLIEVIDAPTIQ